jgi:hypothetical protein
LIGVNSSYRHDCPEVGRRDSAPDLGIASGEI